MTERDAQIPINKWFVWNKWMLYSGLWFYITVGNEEKQITEEKLRGFWHTQMGLQSINGTAVSLIINSL